jgi:hypothetical protein
VRAHVVNNQNALEDAELILSSEEFDTGSPTCRGKSGCLTLNRSIVRHHFKLRRRLSLDSCSRMDMGIGTGMGIGMGGADTVSWL